jgi:hypothetical protein
MLFNGIATPVTTTPRSSMWTWRQHVTAVMNSAGTMTPRAELRVHVDDGRSDDRKVDDDQGEDDRRRREPPHDGVGPDADGKMFKMMRSTHEEAVTRPVILSGAKISLRSSPSEATERASEPNGRQDDERFNATNVAPWDPE